MKIGFVIPWYGLNISGGAESECRSTALQLRQVGFDVEILTTCIKDFRSDWNENFYPCGRDTVEGLPVRRFKVRKSSRDEFHRINRKLMDGDWIGPKEEKAFMEEMVRSDELVTYLKKNQKNYVYIFIPYMFGTTYDGALACPDRSILLPCLHDESYAAMTIFKEMFRGVRGVIFNSKSEQVLAQKLFDVSPERGALIGMGMDIEKRGDGSRFKNKFNLGSYLLYAGRKDEGKNVDLLINYFSAFKENFGTELKLVLIGGGSVDIPVRYRGKEILDLGFVSSEDKWDAYAGAVALCNPSLNESFSIVLMEAWIAGTPVLVHGGCQVTRDHCVSSQGGLFFENFPDFVGCLEYLLENPEKRSKMASNGARYVEENFSWPRVLEKYKTAFKQWNFEFS